jgi:hypothetical protein
MFRLGLLCRLWKQSCRNAKANLLGHESQSWDLEHLEAETFDWLSDGKVDEAASAQNGAVGVEHQVFRRDVEASPSSSL